MTDIILDCDPGHDDAIALLLALASPEVALLGVTTVSGNQTLDKTTANAIRVLDHVGHGEIAVAAGAPRPLVRERHVAAHVHGETGLDGPDLPPPSRAPEPAHAIDWIATALVANPRPVTLVATGPLTNIALFLARYPELETRVERIVLMGGGDRRGQRDTGRRVQHLGRSRGGTPRVRHWDRPHDGRARRHPPGADDTCPHRAARGRRHRRQAGRRSI
jgi:pyrimidine-specific ribonucleoside hydrolase